MCVWEIWGPYTPYTPNTSPTPPNTTFHHISLPWPYRPGQASGVDGAVGHYPFIPNNQPRPYWPGLWDEGEVVGWDIGDGMPGHP